MKKIFSITIVLFFLQHCKANDSTQVLSLKSFLQIVKQFHPAAKQAAIQVDKATASLTIAKGSFDPLLGTDGSNKTFDGINYYQTNTTQLTIPTWYGIEINTGMEYLAGNRTNPTATSGKTSFAGISIPLAKNLLMDKRRAVLQQAKVMIQASEQEKRALLNDLIMDAADAYWQWVQTYLVYTTYNNVIDLNKKRVGLISTAYRLGERPAIDTTEAIAQLQNFEYQQNEALLAWQNATLQLNSFLWKQNNEAYELPEVVLPDKKTEQLYDAVIFPELEKIIADTKTTHPELNIYRYKLNALTIERKLKFQELLPKADLKYNQLGKGYNIASTAAKTLFDNNYRFGVNFSIPLRLSQGRGEYKMAKLKITETQLQQSQKEIAVINKVRNYYNQLVNYKTQVHLLQKTYNNYLQLQRGEETKFFNGESSLFLVNSRENKTLETLLKLTEAAVKFNKAAISLQWAAGRLWQY
ncbi:TolC family protein [Ferruginibacter sp.]|nr:TolC family protein [Ferruginibacter sp.]